MKIVVSGGLNPERIRYFKDAGAPVDSYAVGSYISGATPIDFTGDIKEIDGKPIAKRGRIPGLTAVAAAAAGRPGRLARRATAADGASRRVPCHHRRVHESEPLERARRRPRVAPTSCSSAATSCSKARHYAPGGDRPRAGRPPGARQGVDPRGARPGVLQLRPARAGARDVRGAARDRPVGPLRPLRARPEPQAARPARRGRTHLRLAVALSPDDRSSTATRSPGSAPVGAARARSDRRGRRLSRVGSDVVRPLESVVEAVAPIERQRPRSFAASTYSSIPPAPRRSRSSVDAPAQQLAAQAAPAPARQHADQPDLARS